MLSVLQLHPAAFSLLNAQVSNTCSDAYVLPARHTHLLPALVLCLSPPTCYMLRDVRTDARIASSSCHGMQASFLTPGEKQWLLERNAKRKQHDSADGSMGLGVRQALRDYRTWHLTAMMTTSNVPKCVHEPPVITSCRAYGIMDGLWNVCVPRAVLPSGLCRQGCMGGDVSSQVRWVAAPAPADCLYWADSLHRPNLHMQSQTAACCML